MAKRRNLICVMILVFVWSGIAICTQDPYRTLSLSRSASQSEIKKAYKKLVREWHPDKSDDPSAQEKFIQIQQAYDILSDEDKKREFDQYGYVDQNKNSRSDPFGGRGHPFHHFDFGHGSFKFSSSGSNDPRRVTLRNYQNGILPESWNKPFLLLLTGNFCFNCMNVEHVWSDIAPEIESWGVGMGTVNIDNDHRLASLLGMQRRPAIVGIVQEKVVDFGQGSVTLRTIKEFVDRLLPRGLVQEVNNKNYEDFLATFYDENKPHVLLCSKYSELPLMFRLAAFNFRKYQTFGFTSFKSANTDLVRERVCLSPKDGAILVFKENVEQHVDRLEESQITLQALHHILNGNKYLAVPRLSSQALFEEMCPESPQVIGRRFCVVQITKAIPEHEHFRASFRQIVMNTPSWPQETRMTYMLYERQQEVAMAMEELSFMDEHSVPVAIIWRLQGNQVKQAWLPDGWEGRDPSMERRGLKQFLYMLHDGTAKFPHKLVLPEFNDENAPAWPIRVISDAIGRLRDWGDVLIGFIFRSSWDNGSVLMVVMVIYMSFMLLVFLGLISSGKPSSAENQTAKPDDTRSQSKEGRPSRPESQDLFLMELGHDGYRRLVDRERNSWHLILLVREVSKPILCHQLSRELDHYPLRIPFSFVCLDKYQSWHQALVPGKDEGTVLAIRWSKRHYCIFNPNAAMEGRDSLVRRRSRRTNEDALDILGFIGLGDSDDETANGARRPGVFAGLTHWLDRLQDGVLPKQGVREWPPME